MSRRRKNRNSPNVQPHEPANHPVPQASPRPKIIITGRQMRDVTEESLRALEAANRSSTTIFVRSGKLCRLRTDEKQRPTIEVLTADALRGLLARAADFKRRDASGHEMPTTPPAHVVKDILALPEWNFPAITGIVEVPVLRPDGSVIDRHGYDPSTGLFYWRTEGLNMPPVPQMPTRDQVQAAVALLDDAIGEFPYTDDSSKANAIGLMLTALVRPAIEGCVPLGLIDAPQQGTGKSLLAKIISLIATGRSAAMMAAPDNDEEWRKKITATLIGGATLITIDNLTGTLSSGTLANALSADQWKDRILGLSQDVEVEQRATWMATGNNIRLGGDLQRRCYHIRLDAKTSQPWRGRQYRHPKLQKWVKKNRARLVVALLTIARAWFAAGKPLADVKAIGGYEDWTEVIGGILANAGVRGFLGNLDNLYAVADEESEEWAAFLTALQGKYQEPFSTATLVRDLESDTGLAAHLPSDVSGDWEKRRQGMNFNRRLGKALAARRERRYGPRQHRIVAVSKAQNATVWTVVSDPVPQEEVAVGVAA